MNDQAIIDRQIDIAIAKYGFNMPRSLAKAKAKAIVKEAMKTYNKQTTLSTYLSSKLQKLTRSSYKRSSAFGVPENRTILKPKVKEYIEEYKDSFGVEPTDTLITRKFKITSKELIQIKRLFRSGVTDPQREFSRAKVGNHGGFQLRSIREPIKGIASDIFEKDMSPTQIQRKYNIKKTTYFKYKNGLSSQINRNTERDNISFR